MDISFKNKPSFPKDKPFFPERKPFSRTNTARLILAQRQSIFAQGQAILLLRIDVFERQIEIRFLGITIFFVTGFVACLLFSNCLWSSYRDRRSLTSFGFNFILEINFLTRHSLGEFFKSIKNEILPSEKCSRFIKKISKASKEKLSFVSLF